MSAQALERFLARLYVDARLRSEFVASPSAVAQVHGLDEREAEAVAAVDPGDLELAAASYAMERERYAGKRTKGRCPAWLRALLECRGARSGHDWFAPSR